MTVIYLLEDLPMFWQGRANALRILDRHQTKSDAVTVETARVYEECATELRAALAARPKGAAYRNALMWAFDRLGVDGGMTEKEQLRTMREIGNVLCGRQSSAATYEPNDWDSSAKLPVKQREG